MKFCAKTTCASIEVVPHLLGTISMIPHCSSCMCAEEHSRVKTKQSCDLTCRNKDIAVPCRCDLV
jgi:hypothetical protein